MQLNAQTHVMETNDQQLVSEESAATTENESLLKVKLAAPEHLTIAMPSQGIFYFEVNKYDISESDVEILEQHAEYLKHNTNMMLYVDGFSDNRGPANLNYRLSKKRAQQVGDVLIELGAPESRIKINGYGESFPLNSEMNHVENRRVELEYANIGASDELYAELK
jgi:outer membrane protein OmpA-like peptidoglycan-associated protein